MQEWAIRCGEDALSIVDDNLLAQVSIGQEFDGVDSDDAAPLADDTFPGQAA